MYQEGDKVINSNGVACVIDRIERMKMPHSKIRKNYYVMHDIQKSDNVYYIPQENEENMRSPMTKAEAEGLTIFLKSILLMLNLIGLEMKHIENV